MLDTPRQCRLIVFVRLKAERWQVGGHIWLRIGLKTSARALDVESPGATTSLASLKSCSVFEGEKKNSLLVNYSSSSHHLNNNNKAKTTA